MTPQYTPCVQTGHALYEPHRWRRTPLQRRIRSQDDQDCATTIAAGNSEFLEQTGLGRVSDRPLEVLPLGPYVLTRSTILFAHKQSNWKTKGVSMRKLMLLLVVLFVHCWAPGASSGTATHSTTSPRPCPTSEQDHGVLTEPADLGRTS